MYSRDGDVFVRTCGLVRFSVGCVHLFLCICPVGFFVDLYK